MVHNIVLKHAIPFRGQVMKSRGKHTIGGGMGSVLLNTGGAGGASSYIDIDDYITQTGRNPLKGQGLGNKLSAKLSKLNIEPSASRQKNITM